MWFQRLEVLLIIKEFKVYVSILFVSCAFLLLLPIKVSAEDFKDFAELDIEALLNTEVITASRKVQKLYEAPNAIYVISEEDIKQSGAVDLPDLFRIVPGVDVVSVYGNSYGVSARGFNERFAQRMLFMIDGRSVYTTFFGAAVLVSKGEHIGMDVIREVGPQGAFISTPHTMQHFKKEHWQPQLINRETLEPWIAQGSKTWGSKAVEKARDILETHCPLELPADVQASLETIREAAIQHLEGEHIEA